MKLPKMLVFMLLAVICLLEINCAEAGRDEAYGNEIPKIGKTDDSADFAPTVELSASKEVNLKAPLKVHWKITNAGKMPIFVYSALLSQPDSTFAELAVDVKLKTIDIRFTRLLKLLVEPNDFPKTKFVKIESGKFLEGDYITQYTLLEEITRSRKESEDGAGNQLHGEWNIAVLVGYGSSVELVEKTISNARGRHPIDPVVEWQKLASSKAIKIAFK